LQELRESYRETSKNLLGNSNKFKKDIEELKNRLPEEMIVSGTNGEDQVCYCYTHLKTGDMITLYSLSQPHRARMCQESYFLYLYDSIDGTA